VPSVARVGAPKGIDVSLHARSLDRGDAAFDRRYEAFLEATRGLPETDPAYEAAVHALALEGAGKRGYLRSSRGEDGLFGTLDGVRQIAALLALAGEAFFPLPRFAPPFRETVLRLAEYAIAFVEQLFLPASCITTW
jgi:hypothetical protein